MVFAAGILVVQLIIEGGRIAKRCFVCTGNNPAGVQKYEAEAGFSE